MSGGLLPTTEAHAKAVEALANFGTTAVKEASDLARYIGRVFGTVPEDAVGLVIGDPLHAVRTAIARKLDEMVEGIRQRRGTTERQPVSPSLGIPLLQAAYDESRPELQDLWAQLIASAEDPSRAHLVRKSFIEKITSFDPYDAIVLRERRKWSAAPLVPEVSAYQMIADRLKIGSEEVKLSVDHLEELRCVKKNGAMHFDLTPYGEALMRACSD